MAGDLGHQDEDVMKRLLLLDWFRGRDSTGLASIRNNGDVKIAKVASHPFDLFDMGRFKDALNAFNSCVLLGHNRAATRGVVNTFNAHPFQFEHIVGAHNGTLHLDSAKALNKALGYDYPVDSQSIIAAIAELGIEETVSLLEGSYALTYVNMKDATINFIRNKDRPLWFATSESGKHLFWGSEWPIIQGGLNGEQRPLWRDKKNHGYFAFQENVHYSFSLDALKKGVKGSRPSAVQKEMEGKKTFLPVTGNYSTGADQKKDPVTDPFKRNDNLGTHRTTTSTTTCRGSEKDDKAPNFIVHLDGTKEDPYAGKVDRLKFDEMTQHGCNFCGSKIKWGDLGITIYTRDGVALCPDHSGHAGKDKVRIFSTLVA